jgi:hypothetical protein
MPGDVQLVGIEEAARDCGYSTRHLQRLVSTGRLRRYGSGKRGGTYLEVAQIQELAQVRMGWQSRPRLGQAPPAGDPNLIADRLLLPVIAVCRVLREEANRDSPLVRSAVHWLSHLQYRLSCETEVNELAEIRHALHRWLHQREVTYDQVLSHMSLRQAAEAHLSEVVESRGYVPASFRRDPERCVKLKMSWSRRFVVKDLCCDAVPQFIMAGHVGPRAQLRMQVERIADRCTAKQLEVLALHIAASFVALWTGKGPKSRSSTYSLERKIIAVVLKHNVYDGLASASNTGKTRIPKWLLREAEEFQRERPDLALAFGIECLKQAGEVACRVFRYNHGQLAAITRELLRVTACRLSPAEPLLTVLGKIERAYIDDLIAAGLSTYRQRRHGTLMIEQAGGSPPSLAQVATVIGVNRASVHEIIQRIDTSIGDELSHDPIARVWFPAPRRSRLKIPRHQESLESPDLRFLRRLWDGDDVDQEADYEVPLR